MTDYAKLRSDFATLSDIIRDLKAVESRLAQEDTRAFPIETAHLQALLHSPDRLDEVHALMTALEDKAAAWNQAEQERQAEERQRAAEREREESRRRSAEREREAEERRRDGDRKREEEQRKRDAEQRRGDRRRADAQQERQGRVLRILGILTSAAADLEYVRSSARDADMASAARQGLQTVEHLSAVLGLESADLDSLGGQAEELGRFASELAAEQRHRDENKRQSTGGSGSRRKSGDPSSKHNEGSARAGDPKGYYSLLGIRPGASAEEIKQGYRDRIQQYHPDFFAHEDHEWVRQQAEEMSKKLNEAWEVLGDSDKRREYDRS